MLLTLMSPICTFLNVTKGKLKIAYVSHIVFVLGSTVPKSSISFSFPKARSLVTN